MTRLLAVLAVGFVAVAAAPTSSASAAPTSLVGTFDISPGNCSGAPSGSMFRMILPTGGPSGPYVANSDSPCSDQTYTLLEPGTDGGLVTGNYQPAPSPGFDGSGNSLAERITRPTPFFGVAFSTSTDPNDLQTGMAVPAPSLTDDGAGTLSGDLSAFGATWNNQSFNQGSPKPDGSRPGNTAGPDGTYDASTGAFTLTWTSQIVGGPFNDFTGQWHLEGVFVPAGSPLPPPPPPGQTDQTPADPGGAGRPAGGSETPQVAGTTTATETTAAGTDQTLPANRSNERAATAGPEVPAGRVRVDDDDDSDVGWLPVGAAALGIAGASGLLLRYRKLGAGVPT